MIDYFTSEPMKYFAPPATMGQDARILKLEQMIKSGNYLYGEKTDGNWSRAIITPTHSVLQTRGISKKTGTYGEIQNKVLFWDSVLNAFQQDECTVILGEIFMKGAIDRQIGAILRCLDNKALERQKDSPLHWRIFDVLCYKGQDLMNTLFEKRIQYIKEVVERIGNPLVEGVTYYPMDESFFDRIEEIFRAGGEGAVCYRKDCLYEPGKRGPHAWDTMKVKQEISSDIDCLITSYEKPTRIYTGKDISNWQFWQNTKTGELLIGTYFGAYQLGEPYEPITKNYYYGYPGAIFTSVYDKNGKLVPLCKVAGLTDEMKASLRDHFDEEWYMCPITIGGMMVSEAHALPSIRHPYLKTIRKDDLNPEDCTLEKIIM